ncbi:hypothetical protein LEP1GSC056_1543 [Leptospira borgpetersenii str. Brem 328]|nr:hypothetical protein LEP1GSC056_1543 [Leptospira borgpetersenii str. Brem 328]
MLLKERGNFLRESVLEIHLQMKISVYRRKKRILSQILCK